jgi:hypothetical protein
MFPAVEFLPDAVIERRALAILREHEERAGKTVTIPIPIERILEKTLQLRLCWREIGEASNDIILARIDPSDDGYPTVQLNQRRLSHFETFFGTEQYSMAHEAGHWVLHLDRGRSSQLALFGLDGQDTVLCRRLSDHDRRELQAERFAAFLLLPEHLVRPLLSGRDLSRPSVIAELARFCHVSKTAMRKRLESLGEILVGPDGQIAVPARRPHTQF